MAENIRTLKRGVKGDDVKLYQDNLIKLGFVITIVNKITEKVIADGSFGPITEQATKDFQASAQISVDGKVGSQTRDALNKALNALDNSKNDKYVYKRTLKLTSPTMKGDDVTQWQTLLQQIGFTSVGTIDGSYGPKTEGATKDFQKSAGIEIDGKVGTETTKAMNDRLNNDPIIVIDYLPSSSYPQVSPTILKAVNAELQNVSEIRRKVVQEVLKMVYPYGLYIRGANSYTTSLNPCYATVEMIESGAKSQPEYYDGGRKEWMIGHVEELAEKKEKCFAADCSGLIIGIWRKLGLISPTSDYTANGIIASLCYTTTKSDLKPADCVGSSGHIGLYLGAGYTVEDGGGSMAVQIANIDRTKLINIMKTEKYDKTYYSSKSKWSKFGRPKKY